MLQAMSTLLLLQPLVAALADEAPEPEDVKAGWLAFAVFGLLAVAVVVLCFSLVKRLRNVDRAEEEGRYGHLEEPDDDRPGTDE